MTDQNYCPMQFDCKMMTGITRNCPNLSTCLNNTTLSRSEAMRLYFLNQGLNPYEAKNTKLSDFYDLVFTPVPLSFEYNADWQIRDTIIWGESISLDEETYSCLGGIRPFENLTLSQLQELIDHNFASPLSRHNFAPSIQEFLEFGRVQAHKGFELTFKGYCVSPSRSDYRVSIDGIFFRGAISAELLHEFEYFTSNADEIIIDPNYVSAWWD